MEEMGYSTERAFRKMEFVYNLVMSGIIILGPLDKWGPASKDWRPEE